MEIRGNREYDHLILLYDESKEAFIDITKDVRYLKLNNNHVWNISYIGNDTFFKYQYNFIKVSDNPLRPVYDRNNVFYNLIKRNDIKDILQFGKLGYKVFFNKKTPRYVQMGKLKIDDKGRVDINNIDLEIKKTGNKVFDYYKKLAKYASDISEDETSVETLLFSLYEKVDSISVDSVLEYYTSGKQFSQMQEISDFIYPFSTNLSQIKAVEQVFNNKLSVIAGPPGTGKTQVILNIIANAVKKGMKIAVISNNNTAVDNVYTKMKEENLDFVLAYLGNSNNVNKFFSTSDNLAERISELPTEKPNKNIDNIITKLKDLYRLSNYLVKIKHELFEIEEELKHFKETHEYVDFSQQVPEYNSVNDYLKLKYFLLSLKKVCWLNRLILRIKYKVKYKKNTSLENFINFLEYKCYDCKIQSKKAKIKETEEYIESEDYKGSCLKLKQDSRNLFEYVLSTRYNPISKQKDVYSFDKMNYKKKFDKFLMRYPVILSTTQSLLRNIEYGRLFDLIIIDEASQSDIMTSILSMNVTKRMVVVGDDRQLSQIDNKEIYAMSDTIASKESIEDCYNYKDNSILQSVLSLPTKVPCTILKEHYRCDSRIIEFCNRKFYDNELIICTETSSDDPLLIVHTVEGNHARHNPQGSGWYNEREADEILRIVSANNGTDIGIITPFRAQVECIDKKIKAEHPDVEVEVDTIHKYQGRQKDIIILSTVVNDLNFERESFITDFVTNEKLLNVAISRAVKKIYLVVADKVYKSQNNTIANFIEYIQYYCPKSIQKGTVTSVFDELYKDNKTIIDESKCSKRYDSKAEQIIYDLLMSKLETHPEYKVIMHYRLSDLIHNYDGFSSEQIKYIKHPRTHVDFVVFDKISFKPILCIEVDGAKYHDYVKQKKHDETKKDIIETNNIPFLRLRTNESGEEEKLDKYL